MRIATRLVIIMKSIDNQTKNKRDPEGTRRRILAAAIEEFVEGGLFGARVDKIAKKANTNERMLYYYYGCKEQLFKAVLEHTIGCFVDAIEKIDFNGLDPIQSIVCYARFMWCYYAAHPEIIRIINNENLHRAYYWEGANVPEMVAPAITLLKNLVTEGIEKGQIRRTIDSCYLYLTISALGDYSVSNRFTLKATLNRDFLSAKEQVTLLNVNEEVLVNYLLGTDHAISQEKKNLIDCAA